MQLDYVSQRFQLLETGLEYWGYEIVRDSQFSSWDDQVAVAPVTGLVRIRGERQQGELTVTFSIREQWVRDNIPGRHQAQGASLVHYHYHGQAGSRRIRWCLDETHSPPSHIHRLEHAEDEAPDKCPLITAEEAIEAFEQQIFDAIQAGRLP